MRSPEAVAGGRVLSFGVVPGTECEVSLLGVLGVVVSW